MRMRYDPAMREQPFGNLLAAIAAKTPTPGGGAVTAAVGAIGVSLASMVVAYTTGKKNFEAHEAELQRAAGTLERARDLMLELAAEDERAYAELNTLLKLPESDARRVTELPVVTRTAIQVPLAVIGACIDLLRLYNRLSAITNPRLRSDLAIAAVLIEGAARASQWNVAINLPLVTDTGERQQAESAAAAMLAEGSRLLGLIESACR